MPKWVWCAISIDCIYCPNSIVKERVILTKGCCPAYRNIGVGIHPYATWTKIPRHIDSIVLDVNIFSTCDSNSCICYVDYGIVMYRNSSSGSSSWRITRHNSRTIYRMSSPNSIICYFNWRSGTIGAVHIDVIFYFFYIWSLYIRNITINSTLTIPGIYRIKLNKLSPRKRSSNIGNAVMPNHYWVTCSIGSINTSSNTIEFIKLNSYIRCSLNLYTKSIRRFSPRSIETIWWMHARTNLIITNRNIWLIYDDAWTTRIRNSFSWNRFSCFWIEWSNNGFKICYPRTIYVTRKSRWWARATDLCIAWLWCNWFCATTIWICNAHPIISQTPHRSCLGSSTAREATSSPSTTWPRIWVCWGRRWW